MRWQPPIVNIQNQQEVLADSQNPSFRPKEEVEFIDK
jgi:hypothetical protein